MFAILVSAESDGQRKLYGSTTRDDLPSVGTIDPYLNIYRAPNGSSRQGEYRRWQHSSLVFLMGESSDAPKLNPRPVQPSPEQADASGVTAAPDGSMASLTMSVGSMGLGDVAPNVKYRITGVSDVPKESGRGGHEIR